jgi:RNA polymerase sigma-32 factor
MEGRLSSPDVAFDGHPDDDEDAPFAPAHYVEDHSTDPARELENSDWEETNHGLLEQALGGLDARSQVIVQRRWLDENKATLHDLAAQFGVSAERIRQLEQVALGKLRLTMQA